MERQNRSRSEAEVLDIFAALEIATQEQRDRVLSQGRPAKALSAMKAPRYKVRIRRTSDANIVRRESDAELEEHRG